MRTWRASKRLQPRNPAGPTFKYSVEDQQSQTEQDVTKHLLDQVREALLDVTDSHASRTLAYSTVFSEVRKRKAETVIIMSI
jgi:hypothetical protein